MKKTSNIILGVLLLIILGLITYIILTSDNPVVVPFDDTALREELRIKDSTATYWENQSFQLNALADSLQEKSDSLEALKPTIHEKYNDQINFNNSATIVQLDSVIRANWE